MSEVLEETVDEVDETTDDAVEGEPVARADEPDAAPSAPTIDWANLPPEAEERLAGMSQQNALALLERLGLVSYEEPQADVVPAPDPLADDYAQQLERWYEAKRAADLGPVQEFLRAQQASQTDTVIENELTLAATAAKLDNPDAGLLRAVAAHYAAQPEFARYGATIEGVKATAKAAAEWLVNERKLAREAGVLEYRRQIGEIADTPAEPGAAGTGGLRIEPKAKTYDEIIAKYAS